MTVNTTHKPERVTGAEGLKMAFSAAALAITIGGWGWLTTQRAPEVATTDPDPALDTPQVTVSASTLPDWLQEPPAVAVVPTVMPLRVPPADKTGRTAGNTTAARFVAPSAASAPALREVTPPLREVVLPPPAPAPAPRPAPVARTRSSR